MKNMRAIDVRDSDEVKKEIEIEKGKITLKETDVINNKYKKLLKDVLKNLREYASSNFMIDYIDLLQSVSDAPIEFHFSASLFVLSSITAQRFVFSSASDSTLFQKKDDDSLKGRKLILWFIVLGKSRITRKTSAMINKIDEIVSALYISNVTRVWSTPHLVTQLSALKNNNAVHAVWVLDECSLFFNLLNKSNSYLMDAEAVLSTLYDGKSYSAGTQKRGSEYVPNPHFNIFMASTENLASKFKKDAFEQGFYNRFIFVPAKRQERKKIKRELTPQQKKKAKEILKFLESIQQLDEYTYIFLDEDANKLYDKFEEKIEKKIADKNLGFKESYYGGVPNFVIRIASLLRINRISEETFRTGKKSNEFGLMNIEQKDMELAIKFGELISLWFEKMIDLRTEYNSTSKKVETLEEREAILLNLFKRVNRRELPQNYLRKKGKIATKEMEEALEGFASRGIGKNTGGNTPIMWTLDEDVIL